MAVARRGMMLVLSSPSGAGKSTLARRLVESDGQCGLSVSATTRAQRPAEVEGRDYYFLTQDAFFETRDRGGFLEWAEVFGHYYGTPREPVEAALAGGRDVIFDIDWQGTQSLHEQAARDLVRVFILPPSAKALEERLRTRAQDPEDVVQKRMKAASAEISHWAEYDYVITNVDLDDSFRQLQSILTAERLRRERQVGLTQFVRTMQGELP